MDLFTYLMAKNGNNSSVHGDLFSYLLGKGQSQTQTISGVTIYIPNAKKLVSFMLTKESTQDGEPTPDNPVEVKTVKGYSNLFDKETTTDRTWLDVDGNLVINQNGRSISDYISIKPNTSYTTSGMTNPGSNLSRCYYDINKVFISGIKHNNNNPLIHTSPNNAYYMRESINNIDMETYQITEGDQELPYVPYGNNYVYTKVVGKNLFDKNNVNSINAYIDTNGNILSASNGKSLYINCKSNTTYTVSRIAGTRFRIVDTNVLPEIGIKGNNFVGVDTSKSLTITTSNNAKYLCVNYFNRNTDGDTEQEILNSIQIEEGSTATTYETYKETTTTIPLNNNELVGIGDYKDELLVDKSGHVFINKKTSKHIFDGTETITYVPGSSIPFVYAIDNIVNPTGNWSLPSIYSNCYRRQSWNGGSGDYYIAMTTSEKNIRIRDTRYSAVSDLKTYFQTQYNNNTPVILYYAITTPELIDLQTTVDLKLFKGVNNITNSEDGYMTIQYR